MSSNTTEVNAWTEWAITKRRLDPSTVHAYVRTYAALLHWTKTPLSALTVTDLENFLARPRRGGLVASPATLKREVASLKSLWRWLHDRGHIKANPTLQLVTASVHNESPKPMPDDDWIKLWTSYLPDEERVAYGLAYFCGLRRDEICHLRTDQFVECPRPTIVDVTRKGGRMQNIQWMSCLRLFAEKLPALLPYPGMFTGALERLTEANAGKLLLAGWDHNDDGFFQPDRYNKILARRCTEVNVRSVTPHQFRHSFATNLIAIGTPIPIVARLCGHASIQMTMRYVDTGEDPLAAMLADEVIEGGALTNVDRWGRR